MNISISLKMPARYFRAAFIVDLLDAARVPTPRVPDYGREPELNERQLHAGRRVHEAIEVLGGTSSLARSCVWHVIGLQRSLCEWTIRHGWGGRPGDQKQAQGILIAALGMRDGTRKATPAHARIPAAIANARRHVTLDRQQTTSAAAWLRSQISGCATRPALLTPEHFITL